MKVKFRVTKNEAGDSADSTPFAAIIANGYSNGNTMDGNQLQDAALKNIKNISLSIKPLQMSRIETKNMDVDTTGRRLVGSQNMPVIRFDYKYWVESIEYEVVKIIDASTYLIIEPLTGEILTYPVEKTTKVYKIG